MTISILIYLMIDSGVSKLIDSIELFFKIGFSLSPLRSVGQTAIYRAVYREVANA